MTIHLTGGRKFLAAKRYCMRGLQIASRICCCPSLHRSSSATEAISNAQSGEAEYTGGVAVENAIHILRFESRVSDEAHGALINIACFVREIGAKHEAIGSQYLNRIPQSRDIGVINSVVPHPASSHAGFFRDAGILPCGYAIHTIQQQRQGAADVGRNDLQFGE